MGFHNFWHELVTSNGRQAILEPKIVDTVAELKAIETVTEPEIPLSVLQEDFVLLFLNSVKSQRTLPKKSVAARCYEGSHTLICGHTVDEFNYGLKSCTSACMWTSKLEQESVEFAGKVGTSLIPINVDDCQLDSDRLHSSEELSICPFCYFREVLIRWHYFVHDSMLAAGTAIFSSEEAIENPLSVDLFPEVMEVSRRVNGKVYGWVGPRVVIDCHLGTTWFDLSGFIGRALLNATEGETPLPTLPNEPSFAMVIRGEFDSIKEVKLLPINPPQAKKTVSWNETTEIYNIPARDEVD